MNDTDWSSFRFPPPPPKRWDSQLEDTSDAPSWAAPPQPVSTWHLDVDQFFIIHPKQRKKIDLKRVGNKRRLIKLCELIKTQHQDQDLASLWRALDRATMVGFGHTLPEMLALGPEEWEWPVYDMQLYPHDSEAEIQEEEVQKTEAPKGDNPSHPTEEQPLSSASSFDGDVEDQSLPSSTCDGVKALDESVKVGVA